MERVFCMNPSIVLPPLEQDITASPSDRRNQHWVPESYLRQWRDTNSPQGAYVLVCPKDRSTPPGWQPPKRTFVSTNLNTLKMDGLRNLRSEAIYQAVEACFGKVRSRIVNGLEGSQEDIDAIVHFAAAQIVRAPKFRRYWRFTGPNQGERAMLEIGDPTLRDSLEKNLAQHRKQPTADTESDSISESP